MCFCLLQASLTILPVQCDEKVCNAFGQYRELTLANLFLLDETPYGAEDAECCSQGRHRTTSNLEADTDNLLHRGKGRVGDSMRLWKYRGRIAEERETTSVQVEDKYPDNIGTAGELSSQYDPSQHSTLDHTSALTKNTP